MQPPSVPTLPQSLVTPPEMRAHLDALFDQMGGWLPFDRFMAEALYAPGVGYYANALPKLGQMPADGSDFVTAPELSPVFARTLAKQVSQAMTLCGVDTIWEFGGGSGALAETLVETLLQDPMCALKQYVIVELSAELQARQRARLAPYMDRLSIRWATAWPTHLAAVVIGNEVLDAMPVSLFVRRNGRWMTRGVTRVSDAKIAGDWRLAWVDHPLPTTPPIAIAGEHDYTLEWHAQAQAWIVALAQSMVRGCVLLIDYGFTEAEYYHPQRHMGTLMCHQAHRADTNPLVAVGLKDITTHVDFTAIAVSAQDHGLDVLGFTSQGRFLINCGFLDVLPTVSPEAQVQALKLIHEHEMGELFKVLILCKDRHTVDVNAAGGFVGFTAFDRSHTL